MSKLTIVPYNGEGEAVKRGIATISAEASVEEVVARVSDVISREGVTDIRSVDVKLPDGSTAYAFDVRESNLLQTDGEGAQRTYPDCLYPTGKSKSMNEEENNQDAAEVTKLTAEEKKAAKEAERAQKKAEREAAKADKTAEREAEKAAKKAAAEATKAEKAANKGPTKKDTVLAAMQESPKTVAELADAAGVSETAARSLISDVKRAGVTVTSEKGEDKVTRYSAPSAEEADAPEGE